jgi:hypothetical protein
MPSSMREAADGNDLANVVLLLVFKGKKVNENERATDNETNYPSTSIIRGMAMLD